MSILMQRLLHGIIIPVVKVAISPIAFLQGIYVLLTVPQLPEPAGAREGVVQGRNAKGDSPHIRVVIVGDSAAAGVGAGSMEKSLTGRLMAKLAALRGEDSIVYRLIAKSGSTAEHTIRHLTRIDQEKYDVAVISLGVNDVIRGFSSAQFVANMLSLNDMLRSKFQAKLIVIAEFPPVHMFPALPEPLRWLIGSRCRAFDADLALALQKHSDCVYLRYCAAVPEEKGMAALMASDGFHPGPDIYEVWAEQAAEIINQRAKNDRLVMQN
jgi:lysophospholipase L1-like esterase